MPSYKTITGMDRPLYFMGYTAMQFFLCVVVMFLVAVASVMGKPVFLLLLVVLLVPFVLVGRVLDRENKKGNPDYLTSWQVGGGISRYYRDSDSILFYLKPETKDKKI